MGENYFLTDILYSIKLEDVDDERTVSTAQELISLLQAAWNEKFDDFSDILAVCSQQMRRARAELPQWETDASYAVGRLAGALEIYISLYQADQEIKRIDSILQKELKNSRQTTKKILEVLYEAPEGSNWLTHTELAKASKTSVSSLTNIMKRLIPALAVESVRNGQFIRYHITEAGKRFYEGTLRIKKEPTNIEAHLESLQLQLEEFSSKISETHVYVREMDKRQKALDDKVEAVESHISFYDTAIVNDDNTQSKIGESKLGREEVMNVVPPMPLRLVGGSKARRHFYGYTNRETEASVVCAH